MSWPRFDRQINSDKWRVTREPSCASETHYSSPVTHDFALWLKSKQHPKRPGPAAPHPICDDARAKRRAVPRANSKSKNRPGRSEPRVGENVHRPARDDSGKNPWQPHERRSGRAAQHAFQFANGLCRSRAERRTGTGAIDGTTGPGRAKTLVRGAGGGQVANCARANRAGRIKRRRVEEKVHQKLRAVVVAAAVAGGSFKKFCRQRRRQLQPSCSARANSRTCARPQKTPSQTAISPR